MKQCRQSQTTVHRIIESSWDDETVLSEALNINDDIEKVVSKYEEMMMKKKNHGVEAEMGMAPIAIEGDDESGHFTEVKALVRKGGGSRSGVQRGSQDEMLDDLDEMIFGKKGMDGFLGGQYPNKQQSSKDDLISF